jgi:hypothetical protein
MGRSRHVRFTENPLNWPWGLGKGSQACILLPHMHLPSRQMGTNTPEHWNDTPGNYSTLSTSQQCPVIPTTAPLMTHVSHFSKKDTLSYFLCFILSFWHISRNEIKFPTVYSSDSNQDQRTFPYLHSCHRALCPHNQSPVLSSCPSTTAQSLPPQPMLMPFQRRADDERLSH